MRWPAGASGRDSGCRSRRGCVRRKLATDARARRGQAAALWSALALYSLGAALLVLFARGPAPLSRYSPGADGFWLAVIALSLWRIWERPRRWVVCVNAGTLIFLVVGSVWVDFAALRNSVLPPWPPSCESAIVDYPLVRISLFIDATCGARTRVSTNWPRCDCRYSATRLEGLSAGNGWSVVTDMPNRWLSVYVRDYMLAGVPAENIYSVAPFPGMWPTPAEVYSRPFDDGELSTDVLPDPLLQSWRTVDELAGDVSLLKDRPPVVRYLTAKEMEADFATLERRLTRAGYRALSMPIAGRDLLQDISSCGVLRGRTGASARACRGAIEGFVGGRGRRRELAKDLEMHGAHGDGVRRGERWWRAAGARCGLAMRADDLSGSRVSDRESGTPRSRWSSSQQDSWR